MSNGHESDFGSNKYVVSQCHELARFFFIYPKHTDGGIGIKNTFLKSQTGVVERMKNIFGIQVHL